MKSAAMQETDILPGAGPAAATPAAPRSPLWLQGVVTNGSSTKLAWSGAW
jgi:hypothetical protein